MLRRQEPPRLSDSALLIQEEERRAEQGTNNHSQEQGHVEEADIFLFWWEMGRVPLAQLSTMVVHTSKTAAQSMHETKEDVYPELYGMRCPTQRSLTFKATTCRLIR